MGTGVDWLSQPQARVLVVGDVMLDESISGDVQRISQEAPVPVLHAQHTRTALGGCGNVARNLRSLGAEVTLVGVVGDDPAGAMVRELVVEHGITDALVEEPGRQSTRKLRLLAQGQQMLRVDHESAAPVAQTSSARLQRAVEDALADCSAVLISDYAKGVLDPETLAGIIQAAQQAQKSVFVDPKGSDYTRYAGATVLTPNLKELAAATGFQVDTQAQRDDAAKKVLDQTQAEALVVTCGKEGMVLYAQGDSPTRVATSTREVYDVTGAGDTVIAALTLARLHGQSWLDAVRLANVAAGVVVSKVGTAAVSPHELRDAWQKGGSAASKVMDAEALTTTLQQHRDRGRSVVFTNGCFDILHVGHVEYLKAARGFGDVLIVGLNSDASVSRLKGPDRPLVDQATRARMLAALDVVDGVVVFEEDTPAALIKTVRPNVLVKGADYKPDEVVGRDFVESYGGRLELVPLVDGQSTSKLIDRIVKAYG